MQIRTMSLATARRAALAAQGLAAPRPASTVNAGHIRRAVRRLGLLQLDFVNVLVPAHQMVLFSRLGPYDLDCFDRAIYGDGHFVEQWAHEASIVPTSAWPWLQHRRERFRPWPNSPIMKLKRRGKYLGEILDLIVEKGEVTSQDLPPVAGPKRKPGDWHRSVPRWALEYHFGNGTLAVRRRLANFQRVYDLAERVIAPEHFGQRLNRADQQRDLLRQASRACGIATLSDLADYFRMTIRDAAPRVLELVDAGELQPLRVEGWDKEAYLSTGLCIPRRVRGASLLSPFDPLVWYRPRAERLFDFHYRIEIYVPAAKRKWGYYVLPFLLDDRIVARVDLKADRKNRVLQVLAAHPEPGNDPQYVADELQKELFLLCRWLQLDTIKVGRRGSLAVALSRAVRAAR